jgi:hypothetical protein
LARLQCLRQPGGAADRRPHRGADGRRNPEVAADGTVERQPRDIPFFGPSRFGARANESGIVQIGIALSNTFMIDSWDEGVYVQPLTDWHRAWFSWARRVL